MLSISRVKIQLTKDKTIDIDFSKFSSGGKKSKTDLVGVELFSGMAEGAPAVHIYRKKDAWHLGAAALVPPPAGELPLEWSETTNQPHWTLPREFQAPGAAIAVNSTMGVFGQSSPEAVIRDMMQGVGAVEPKPALTSSDPGKKKFSIAKKSQPPAPVPQNEAMETKSRPQFPDPGVPVSYNGRRFVVKPFAEDGFHLSASIPEFQALWLGRLLPEGHRPTAVSIQLAESALMASVLAQPEYVEHGGSLLTVFVKADCIYFAGYKEGMPVLWRQCPNVRGYIAMRKAIKKTLGVEEELVNEALEESLVDPRPALEPFLHPVLDQLELARAYLADRHGITSDRILLLGLPHGGNHWNSIAKEALKVDLVSADPFEGLTLDKGVEVNAPTDYLIALGSALAASEVES